MDATARTYESPHRERRLPILLTVDEAADFLRTTRRAIYAMVERRQLPGVIRIRRRVLSGIVGKESILTAHLIPQLGSKRLDAITTEDVQALKRRLVHRAPKTVNNVLTVLNMLLKKAVEWDVIERTATPTSSCCWAVRPAFGWARSWRSNGATSISASGSCVSSAPTGGVT